MNSLHDISAKQLFGAAVRSLQKSIGDATDRARSVLERGEFIRTKRRDGNVNSSYESTAAGAICVANDIAKRFSLDERPIGRHHSNHAFFGANLHKTINAFRVLGRR